MIEIGVVKELLHNHGAVRVQFTHLNTEVECQVLQPAVGVNTLYILPTKETQVVCHLEDGKNFVIGSLFSLDEPIPPKQSDIHVKCGNLECAVDNDKLSLKNNLTSFKTLLKDVLTMVKNLTLSTSMGPSGTPLPPTIIEIERLNSDINNLLND